MATFQTPNLDLTYGDQGETDWHIWMNSNIQKLDFDFNFPLEFDPNTLDLTVAVGTIKTGGSGTEELISGSGEEFLAIEGISDPSLTEDDALTLLPVACRIKNLRVYLPVAPGTSNERIFTLRVNGVDSALSVTLTGTNQSGADVSNIVELGAGERVCLSAAVSGVAAASRVYFGLEVEQYGVGTDS